MECFRQIFRCIKAPFTRNKGRVLEIGPPMNFRKEELPACFSDAESVLSPNQYPIERPVLTYQSQHPDVSEQPRSIGEGADNDRDDGVSNVDQGKDSEPRSKDERQAAKPRLRERVSPSRWFRSTSTLRPSHETEAMDELEAFTTAEEKPKDLLN